MPSFQRRPGESAACWLARLRGVDAAALSHRKLKDLTACRIEAELAGRREAPRRAAAGPEEAAPPPLPEPPDALQECKEAVRALSPQDRLRLIWWLHSGMAD
jgi:hypothetical protein